MNVWVLSHLKDSIGTRITMELFDRAGHQVEHLDPDSVHLGLDPNAEESLQIFPRPQCAEPDLIYTRLGSSAPARALDVLRHLESRFQCVNGSRGLELSRDKFRSYQLMARAGLPVPRSVLVTPHLNLDSVRDFLGPAPWVVKIPQSTKGAGVCIVESVRSLASVVGTLLTVHDRIVVQEFVREAANSDVRVLVFGDEAAVAVRRSSASDDEFRSNVALGGVDSRVELDEAMSEISVSAAQLHGLEVAGIDLLECNGSYLIAEVNGSPGLFGPHRQHGESLETAFRRFIEPYENQNP